MEGSQCRNEYSPPSSRLYTRGETSSVPPLSPHSRVHLANVLACTLVSAGCILVHDDPPKLCCSVKRRGESREGAFRREMRTVCLEWWCKKRSVMRKVEERTFVKKGEKEKRVFLRARNIVSLYENCFCLPVIVTTLYYKRDEC